METITREQADEAMKPIWAIKEKIYEETKDMTLDEWFEYTQQKSEAFLRRMEGINFDEIDRSLLYGKKKDENQ